MILAQVRNVTSTIRTFQKISNLQRFVVEQLKVISEKNFSTESKSELVQRPELVTILSYFRLNFRKIDMFGHFRGFRDFRGFTNVFDPFLLRYAIGPISEYPQP